MPPSLRSTSGLSTSPSLPPPASLLAENAKPHLHPMMHSSPGIPQSFTLRCSRSKASPHHGGLAAIGAEQRRPSLKHMHPSIAGVRAPASSCDLMQENVREEVDPCPVVPTNFSALAWYLTEFTQHNMLLQYQFFQCLFSEKIFRKIVCPQIMQVTLLPWASNNFITSTNKLRYHSRFTSTLTNLHIVQNFRCISVSQHF